MSFAIAAAGTGGHIYPALAVAEELVTRGHSRSDIVFIGGDRLERSAIPAAGYELLSVEIRGLRRSLSPKNLALPSMVWRASAVIRDELRERAVGGLLVMGGYIAVPAAWGAVRAGVPYVVHEQNGRPGLANRLVARRAARVLVAFPGASRRLPRATVVGNPLRQALVTLDKSSRRVAARTRYGLDPKGVVVGIMGGSQGAASINAAVARYASRSDRASILHLTGATHAAGMSELAATARIPWRIVAFEDSMEDFYAASDLVVCRAGASTVSELAVTGTPAILVPLEAVAQEDNADHLVAAGAAQLLRQSRLDELEDTIDGMLGDRSQLEAMATAAEAVGHPDAATHVAIALEEVGRG